MSSEDHNHSFQAFDGKKDGHEESIVRDSVERLDNSETTVIRYE